MADTTGKVVLATGEVLIDLTQDDVKPEHVQKGITFHDKTGAEQTGTNTKTVDASSMVVHLVKARQWRQVPCRTIAVRTLRFLQPRR